ncbi:MAG: T9SS type A sorting domain-containing protein [Flavipsychrobacter sp.]|nr:T9SS type A sorting domain-containing protein [Flavipsychrobacter sp.]
MNITARAILTAIAAIFCQGAHAQFEGQVYQSRTDISVWANGQERTLAWCGGFNNPQLAMGDLNNDGRQDLVIYEKFNRQVKTFINYGTPGNPDYRYDPRYALQFPQAAEYLILADYNDDNIPDLFERGLSGYEVWRGYYNGSNELCFTYYKALNYTNDSQTIGVVNAYVEPSDIPAVYDIDNDGDLDFVAFYAGGSRFYYYRNMRVEDGLPADSISIKLRDRCWGKSFQGFERTYTLAYPCSNAGLGRSAGGDTRHTGNTLCLLDADGDGDADILNGNLSFSDIQFLVNGKAQGTTGTDSIVAQDTTWKGYSNAQWPSAFALDIDQDGKQDVLITPHADLTSENYKTIAYYRNTGTSSSPVFTYQSDTFLVDKTIDAGTNSRPLFYDYDKDGKPDLIVGSDGYYQNGLLRSRLSYYRNTSTPGNPSFEFQSHDLVNVAALSLRGSSPAAGDLDGDGKDDLVIGQADGTLTMFTNTAASGSVQPIWANPVVKIQDVNPYIIDVGQAAAPLIYDIDQDGRPDLLIGNSLGYLSYYRNVNTTPGVLALELVNDQLGGVKTDPQVSFLGHCTPFIGKMDNTNVDYLVSGSTSGTIYRFTGFQGGDTAVAYPMIDSAYSWITNAGIRTAPAIADVDGDGWYEMVVGNQFGGLFLYRQWVNASAGDVVKHPAASVKIWPNPAAGYFDVSWSRVAEEVSVTVVNSLGQVLYQRRGLSGESLQVETSGWASGLYFCTWQSAGQRVTQRVAVMR